MENIVGDKKEGREICVQADQGYVIYGRADVNYNEAGAFDPAGFEPILGGEVRDVCTTTRPPTAKSAADPKYPPNAPRGYNGKIILDLKVSSDGHVRNAAVLQSLQSDLDADALRVVKTWEFEPGTCDGKPVTSLTRIEVTYHTW